jgi:hypothetical protein
MTDQSIHFLTHLLDIKCHPTVLQNMLTKMLAPIDLFLFIYWNNFWPIFWQIFWNIAWYIFWHLSTHTWQEFWHTPCHAFWHFYSHMYSDPKNMTFLYLATYPTFALTLMTNFWIPSPKKRHLVGFPRWRGRHRGASIHQQPLACSRGGVVIFHGDFTRLKSSK